MTGVFEEKILLYRLLKNRDQEAFAALYDKYVKQIYRFVYFKVSGSAEAEDITSEVFLKTWNYLQENREVKSFSGLLYRVARNCIIDHYRVRAQKNDVPIDEDVDVGDNGEWYNRLNVQVESERIVQAIKKLKQEYREVITLRYIDELELDEIAEITSKSSVSVRVTLHRALKKLKQITEENVKAI